MHRYRFVNEEDMTHGRYHPVAQCKLTAVGRLLGWFGRADDRGRAVMRPMRPVAGRGEARAPRASAAAHRLLAAALAMGGVMPACAPMAALAQPVPEPRPHTVVGDAITRSLSGAPGDAARGRAIVTSRQVGLCLLCHTGPFPEERFQGTLAPDLAGAGGRWSEGQLRLRLADSRRLDPASIMPSYYRTDHLTRVGSAWRAQPVLTAQQIEDVVALLRTLRD
jgi:sulfur-oxidizing protein SoxX